METKYTPTPWRIEPGNVIVANRPDSHDLPLAITQVYHIIHYGDQRDREMSNSNTKRIVECVNGYDALAARVKELEKALNSLMWRFESHENPAPDVVKARAALRGTKC